MSVYAYKCQECGNIFTLEASLKERESAQGDQFTCPKCKSKKIVSHFSPVNFLKNIFSKDDYCGCIPQDGPCCGKDKKGNDSASCCG